MGIRQQNEWNDFQPKSAVADLTGRRFGQVSVVVKKGTIYRVVWEDGEVETLHRKQLLARYTTYSSDYKKSQSERILEQVG